VYFKEKLPGLNIAFSTASESAAKGRRIVEQQGLKLLVEDFEKSE